MIEAAEKFTIKERIGKVGKVPLREAASKLELPEDIANRKKKAAQYGSGSQKAIKDIIKHKIEFKIEFENKKLQNLLQKQLNQRMLDGWILLLKTI
uniref:Asparagine synthetase domain-containing protein n=1 Tax=uncultured marine group II/III euryarchaeote AD1000_41_D11 TaxID=1457766 RepID=A0A075FWY0_9EURY|nr:hypothetical protein [uncultured marine group II/III euryarchaeote AD1000_41_D11]